MINRLRIWVYQLALFLFSSASFANGWIPYPPHMTFDLATGSQSLVYGDMFLPLWGDLPAFGWIDFNGQYGSRPTYYFGGGVGGRGIINCSSIFGGYLFIDRSYTTIGPDDFWWVLNPGFEYILPLFDSRINFYFPYPTTAQRTRNFLKGTPRGFDADVGYTFPNVNDFRVHGGVYYYRYNDSPFNRSFKGIEGGASYYLNDYFSVFSDISFDTRYGTSFLAGIQFEIDAARAANAFGVIEQRMNIRVRRHVGTLYTSAGIPDARRRI